MYVYILFCALSLQRHLLGARLRSVQLLCRVCCLLWRLELVLLVSLMVVMLMVVLVMLMVS